MKKTILYIDDIESNLFTMQSALESLYEVHIALSAHEGLDIILRNQIDLILLDVMMPEIDGFTAAKMIKSNKRTKEIPIIFVTAKNDDKTIESCYKIGGNDYISKPFNHIELLSRISFHLNLREKEKLLQQEKAYAQSIIDLQENMILTTDANKVIGLNNSVLKFFNMSSLEEFQKNYGCVCNSFMEEEGFFSLSILDKNVMWIDEVIKRSKDEDILVKISKDSKQHIFNVKAIIFQTQYIVTLTDITHITKLTLEYKHEANYDSLTQVYNRNMFHRLMSEKIVFAEEENKKFVFILLDIDFFKKVNDTYGHLVGDSVLKSISALIKSHIRDKDIFARWGGEEFILALDVSIEKGVEIANNLRKYIENEKFDVVNNITCSFGVTESKQSDTIDSITKRADSALYKAKESGRNRVVCEI